MHGTVRFSSMSMDSVVRTGGLSGLSAIGVICALCTAIVACASPAPAAAASSGTLSPTPPASPAPADYRRIEDEVVSELNAVRTNPSAYASHVATVLSSYDGKLRRRGNAPAIRTLEGTSAVREAINALAHQPALGRLSASVAMSRAARDLAVDQNKTGGVGHSGSDGSSPGTRLGRYGAWGTSYAENIDYGPFTSGRDVVIDLLIDDGVPDRGHRHNIFDPLARVMGVSCAPHPRYGSVCVIDQAGSYTPRSERRFQN